MRAFASALVSILLAATASAAIAADPKPGGAINVATVGEPPTLDPMESPADVVGIISQHIFETLYTWGDGWKVVPLLAASDAEVSADGKTYTIPLRTGVKFHDGSDMTSEDVKASLERWMRVAQRGKQAAEKVGERRGDRTPIRSDHAEGAVRAAAATARPADQCRHHPARREAGAAR